MHRYKTIKNAKKLQAWMWKHGITRPTLAKMLKCSPHTTWLIARGRVNPKLDFALMIEMASGGEVLAADWLDENYKERIHDRITKIWNELDMSPLALTERQRRISMSQKYKIPKN